ncbi:MAG: aspartate aminotransferase family protein [Sphaerochaetaceae bacterium]
MNQENLIKEGKEAFLGIYSQFPIVLDSGDNASVTDIDGNTYLDFVAGIATNIFGYNDQGLKNALKNVIDNGLLHTSNLYWNKYAISAAKGLKEISNMERVFFCNSGTEANEAAIKLVRKYGSSKKKGKTKIISLENSFHGRTLGSLSATGQKIYQDPFKPLAPDFSYVPINDIEALKESVTEKTCAIFIEAVQGEGGIISADSDYLRKVRQICDENEIVLVCDEVQCGMGRTGEFFGWQKKGIVCDVMTLAKGLGGGVAIGAMVVSEKFADVLKPGDHGTTLGGNLLAACGADYVISRLKEPSFLEHVKKVSAYFETALKVLQKKYPQILEIRIEGLMVGLVMNQEVRPMIDRCLKEGLLVANAGPKVLRMVPPLIVTEKEIDLAVAVLDKVLSLT